MNSKDLYNAIGKVDDDILEQSETAKKKTNWLKWGAVAACLCLVIGGGIFWMARFRTGPGGLPMLRVQDSAQGSMGFEGVLCYDINEINNGNPWREDMTFSSLPVFENRAYHPAGEPVGLDEAAVLNRLEAACTALGLEGTEPKYERSGARVLSIKIEAGGMTVTAEADGTVTVNFEEGLALPEGLRFTWYDTSSQEAQEAMAYFTRQFDQLLNFEEPEIVLSGGYIMWNDYDQAGNYLQEVRFEREYMLYEGAGDETEQLLNYKMHYARFYPDDEGRLSLIRIYDNLSCADKLGDYPIITQAAAREALLRGNYITSVPYAIEDETLVQKVELVYRSGASEQTLMPYYRFYVELPDMRREDGLTDFGAYYVPAVSPEYISNMPLWDSSFN